MTVYRVRHETRYRYAEAVVSSHNEAHLMPRRGPTQALRGIQLRIDPTPDTVRWHEDYFGNDVVFFALQTPHSELTVQTESTVELSPAPPPDPGASSPWEQCRAALAGPRDAEALAAREFIYASRFVPVSAELAAYGRPCFPPGRSVVAGVIDLCQRIHADFRYDSEATDLDTPIEEVLRERHGVCQDFAHVMIGVLRSLGLPARYVSGYLRSRLAGDDKATPALVGAEASHAWVAAWCPALGWFEVDPTNDLVPSDRHVVLGHGRDYEDVSPVKGVTVGGGSQTVSVEVRVEPA